MSKPANICWLGRLSCRSGRTTIGVAAQFSFSVSFVDKLLHRQRTTGSVAAADRKAPVRDELRACLHQGSDATLRKLSTWLSTIGSLAVSRSILWRIT